MLIKDQKQHPGLGDYRMMRLSAVVRHLHLVDAAYACLTHLANKEQKRQGAKGKQPTKKKPLALTPISQVKTRMRQVIWHDAVEDVVKVTAERPVLRRIEKLARAA